MPSFFYHLAFDLTTELSLKLQSAETYWDAFQVKSKTSVQHRPTSKAPLDLDARSSALLKAGTLKKPVAAGESTNQSCGTPGSIIDTIDLDYLREGSSDLSSANDWRYGKILTQGVKMAQADDGDKQSSVRASNGIGAGQGGLATKGRFEALSTEEEELGWGVVRLYRDGEETPGLYDEPTHAKGSKTSKGLHRKEDEVTPAFKDEDCTTLCILAVPSYLTPSDFLGFVGEKTREEVSHFRMVRTEKSNRYMVLMKFRNGKKAREWRREWNGKAFDGMEVYAFHPQPLQATANPDFLLQPENCHVVFVKSIAFLTPFNTSTSTSFPDMTNDPFTPSTNLKPQPPTSSSRTTKPLAPPTPALIELPTCPVCLERMDESTGLLTILCQHVFHCSCLQKWRGSGCPVCRYTQKSDTHSSSYTSLEREREDGRLNECHTCHSDSNLWICLICGSVGCGRYDAAHAFAHYTESAHAFAMDLQTQRVWDYASDGYVHRLVQNAHDGKLVDLSEPAGHGVGEGEDDYDDFVPRSKLQTAGVEYTHLLTSQLDSQRMYFEGILERAADKASLAAQSAEKAHAVAEKSSQQLEDLQRRHDELVSEVQDMRKERDRAGRKAEKFEGMARRLEGEWREEKTVSGSLMERIGYLEKMLEGERGEKEAVVGEKRELEETVRDLMFSLSGSQKIKEMGVEGEGGDVSLPERVKEEGGDGAKEGGGNRGKGKKKKGKK